MKIAVNTGGGDAPGLNAVIRAVTMAALRRGWQVEGLRYGYRSLVDDKYPAIVLDEARVSEITKLGGTILGAVNRGNPFDYPITNDDGSKTTADISDKIVENFKARGYGALVAIGGDGSLSIAHKLGQKGIPVIGVPKTIDNDLEATWLTFGFDTAVHNATDAIDKLHTTARSHERVMVVEVMGRDAGWIALHAGIAGDADVILLPELPFRWQSVFEKVKECYANGQNYAIVVVGEGAKAASGHTVILTPREVGRARRLGGIGTQVAEEIAERTGHETRVMVLGHIQRGGEPTTFDRVLALRFGTAAVRAIERGEFDTMVSFQPPNVVTVPLEQAAGRIRLVSLDCDTIQTARALGISFGD